MRIWKGCLTKLFLSKGEFAWWSQTYSGDTHFLEHAHNISHASELQELATEALAIEVVCYHAGPWVIPAAVYPKSLKRHSTPLVCQIFNKAVPALTALKTKLKIIEGNIKFAQVITN